MRGSLRVSPYRVREDMEAAGFTRLATTMGIRSLLEKEMLATTELYNDQGDTYTAYQVTSKGMRWLFDNKDKVALRKQRSDKSSSDVPF
jgi:hypothetical protein